MNEKYSVVVQYSDEDEGYIAIVPELPDLSAFGKTQEEAIRELSMAREAYLDVCKEDGCALPEPEKLNSFSGQTRVRLPKSLHAALSREANFEGVSLNTYLVRLLSERNIAQRVENRLGEIERELQILRNQQVPVYIGDFGQGVSVEASSYHMHYSSSGQIEASSDSTYRSQTIEPERKTLQ